jgi:hypothetical protein
MKWVSNFALKTQLLFYPRYRKQVNDLALDEERGRSCPGRLRSPR